jgi:hypothetical protein
MTWKPWQGFHAFPPRFAAGGAGRLRARLTGASGVAAVLAIFWCLMMAGVLDRSATFDEPIHAAGGLAAWQLNDFRLNPESGILPQRLAGLGMWGAHFPATGQPAFRSSDEWEIARQLFDDPGLGNDYTVLLLRGRLAMSVLALALALTVYLMSRSLFGPGPGLLSLLLISLCPGLLANGPLITADTACALFLLLASAAMWAAFHRVTLARLLAGGILVGCALASKMSGALIIPIGLSLVFLSAASGGGGAAGMVPKARMRRFGTSLGVLVVQIALGAGTLWAFFGFRYAMMSGVVDVRDVPRLPWENLASNGVLGTALGVARRFQLLPESYLYGFSFQSALGPATSAHLRPAFMNGQVSLHGWIGFFPYVFMVKTPLPVLLILGAAAIAWLARALARSRTGLALWPGLLRTAPLWVLLVVYGVAALTSRINVGHRHLLPLYAPLFVLAGSLWVRRPAGSFATVPSTESEATSTAQVAASSWLRKAIVAAMLLLAADVGRNSPDHLTYFNQLAGGPEQGWRHLVDSSLDWGQDLPALSRAVRATTGNRYISYFGSLSPRRRGLEGILLPAYFGIDVMPPLRFEAQRPGTSASETLTRAAARWPEHQGIGWLTSGEARVLLLLEKPSQLRLTGGTYFISASMLQPLFYADAVGPWNEDDEQRYRQLEAGLAPVLSEQAPPRLEPLLQTISAKTLAAGLREFEWLRFARLTAYLRGREPDGHIHHSILIFRLSDDDVRRAIAGPVQGWGVSRRRH